MATGFRTLNRCPPSIPAEKGHCHAFILRLLPQHDRRAALKGFIIVKPKIEQHHTAKLINRSQQTGAEAFLNEIGGAHLHLEEDKLQGDRCFRGYGISWDFPRLLLSRLRLPTPGSMVSAKRGCG